MENVLMAVACILALGASLDLLRRSKKLRDEAGDAFEKMKAREDAFVSVSTEQATAANRLVAERDRLRGRVAAQRTQLAWFNRAWSPHTDEFATERRVLKARIEELEGHMLTCVGLLTDARPGEEKVNALRGVIAELKQKAWKAEVDKALPELGLLEGVRVGPWSQHKREDERTRRLVGGKRAIASSFADGSGHVQSENGTTLRQFRWRKTQPKVEAEIDAYLREQGAILEDDAPANVAAEAQIDQQTRTAEADKAIPELGSDLGPLVGLRVGRWMNMGMTRVRLLYPNAYAAAARAYVDGTGVVFDVTGKCIKGFDAPGTRTQTEAEGLIDAYLREQGAVFMDSSGLPTELANGDTLTVTVDAQ